MAAPPESTPHPVSLQPSVAAALQGQRRATERAIIHLDMDCFFASIAVQVGLSSYRLQPTLQRCFLAEIRHALWLRVSSLPTQGHPSFRGKPLCVCHSNSAVGSAEVSSANYEARDFGVHAGMSMSRAKQRCPHLLVLPYEVRYQRVSVRTYRWAIANARCQLTSSTLYAEVAVHDLHTAHHSVPTSNAAVRQVRGGLRGGVQDFAEAHDSSATHLM